MPHRLRWMVGCVLLALGIGLGGQLTWAQGGPFSAQIETFWRLISNGGRTFIDLRATAIQLTAGSGTATMRPAGVIYTAFPNTTNLADTNYVCNEWTAIPASTLVNVGDEIRIETTWEADATGGSRTYRIAFGYTSCANDGTGFTGGTVVQNNSTTTASASYLTTTRVLKTGASTQRSYSLTAVAASAQQTATTTPAITDTAAIKIGAALKDAGGSAGAIILRTVKVSYIPAQ